MPISPWIACTPKSPLSSANSTSALEPPSPSWKHASQSAALGLLNRYAARHHREWYQALNKLQETQRERLENKSAKRTVAPATRAESTTSAPHTGPAGPSGETGALADPPVLQFRGPPGAQTSAGPQPKMRLTSVMRLFSGILGVTGTVVFAAQAGFAASAPVVRLLNNGAPSVQTAAATVSLEGVAIAERDVVNVLWSDQLGHGGAARWTPLEGRPHAFRWTAEAVPVHTGPNQITISVIDIENQAGMVHVMVHRTGESMLTPGGAVVEGDILAGTRKRSQRTHGMHTEGFTDSYTKNLWPSVAGVVQVPYTIQGTSANLTTAINTFNSTFTGSIQFVPLASQANYVTIVIDPNLPNGEGQSSVGMQGLQQFLNCSPTCAVATFLHEMGHTVGLLHEHQRPDAATWVKFTNANADEPLVAGNFTSVPFNDQAIGLYDHQSLMHYGAYGFSKNGLPTLESVPAGIPLGNNNGYTAGDRDQVLRLYGFAPSLVTITTNPPGLSIKVDNVTYTAPQTFNWALNSTHTLNLPADPQFTNPNDGATYKFGAWNDAGAKSHTITVYGGVGTLTSPAASPAITVYQASYIRLWPFTLSVTPTGTGTAAATPAAVSEFGGTFFTDRQLITLTATPNSGWNLLLWSGLPYPASANPRPFQVQAPLTSTQAAFTAQPLTIVGASITGPNTSLFPGMYAYIDSAFWYLPQSFQWGVGTQHTVNVDNPESPITTNVRYTWNNWSDGLAQSHTITQPSTGAQNVTASFTPVYRTYPLPYNSCAGSVSFSPISPTGDGFYADGTVLTITATPNSAVPPILFAGWTGDLTGSVNPQSTTIHNQFIPVANFNATTKPIAITSYSPVSLVATAAAQNLTIAGTGFTSTTLAYWNSSFRSVIFVSSTKITMHLNAGDLASAGGQDVFVGNYDNICENGFESQYIVNASLAAEAQLQIAKTHTGNFTKGQTGATYTVTVSNQVTSQPTTGKVTVMDTIPSGLTLVSMAGTGWTCAANSCNRSDALASGSSYPAITVTVNVASNAPAKVTNTATATGGGSAPATAKNPTTIN